MKPGVDYIGVSVSFCCHDKSGNWLLGKRSKNCRDEIGNWDFGGGKLEFGESPEEGVLRELKEEYGVEGLIEEALPVDSILREHDGKPTHWIHFSYIIQIDPSKVVNGEPEAIDEIGWFKFENFPKPLHTAVAVRVVKHRQIFLKYSKANK